jgi:hypothetical protein
VKSVAFTAPKLTTIASAAQAAPGTTAVPERGKQEAEIVNMEDLTGYSPVLGKVNVFNQNGVFTRVSRFSEGI